MSLNELNLNTKKVWLNPRVNTIIVDNGTIIENLDPNLPVQTDENKNLISKAIDLNSDEIENTLQINHGGTGSANTLVGGKYIISQSNPQSMVEGGSINIPSFSQILLYGSNDQIQIQPGGGLNNILNINCGEISTMDRQINLRDPEATDYFVYENLDQKISNKTLNLAGIANGLLLANENGDISQTIQTDGEIIIGRTGLAPISANITGTSNQTIISSGSGTINISLPQDIATISTPTFNNLILSSLSTNLPILSDAGKNLISGLIDLTTQVTGILPIANSEAKIISVTGTANRINISGTATIPIFDISNSYIGQNSITTLGTIGTGIWHGTAIDGQYLNYNTNNLKVTANQINTIQDISTGSNPSFHNLTLNELDTFSIEGNSSLHIGTTGITTSIGIGAGGCTTQFGGTLKWIGTDAIMMTSTSPIGQIYPVVPTFTNGTITIGPGSLNFAVAQPIDPGSSPTFVDLSLTSLTANLPILSDGSKNLVSGQINLATQVMGILPTTNTQAQIISVSGTTNRISIAGTSTVPIFDISSSYVGQNSITTLGTIGSGIWNGTAIDGTYINYNTTNLQVSSSKLNTIQDISITANPKFNDVILTSHVFTPDLDSSILTGLTIGTSNTLSVTIGKNGITTTINGTPKLNNLTASFPLQLDASKNIISSAIDISTTAVTGILSVSNGGTGANSYTNGQLLIGNTTGNTLTKSTLTAGNSITVTNGTGSITLDTTQDLRITASPTFSNLLLTGTGAVLSGLTASLPLQLNGVNVIVSSAINLSGASVTSTLGVGNGGTGTNTYTNGQLLIGNTTGNTLTKSTLTAGNSVTVTNGTGSITIDAIQDIRTSATPTFNALTLGASSTLPLLINGATNQKLVNLTGNHNSNNSVTATYLNDATIVSTGAIGTAIHQWIYPNHNATGGTISNAYGILIDGGSNAGGTVTNVYGLYASVPVYGTNKYCAVFAGNVGMGWNTPTHQLQLGTDDAVKPSTNTWTVSSDQRIKKNINDMISTIALDKINQIKVRTFEYIDDYKTQCKLDGCEKIGVIAQELQTVLPQCVKVSPGITNFGKLEDEKGNIILPGTDIQNLLSVNMDQVNYLLISCIQQLTKRITDLEQKINLNI